MFKPPVPGEAPLDPRTNKARSAVIVRNVALGSLMSELRADALVDTGAATCIVPHSLASALGLNSANRIDVRPFDVVGGQRVFMDVHRLRYVRAGTAEAQNVLMAVSQAGPASRLVLLGLTFMGKFDTMTVDFDGGRVLFRGVR